MTNNDTVYKPFIRFYKIIVTLRHECSERAKLIIFRYGRASSALFFLTSCNSLFANCALTNVRSMLHFAYIMVSRNLSCRANTLSWHRENIVARKRGRNRNCRRINPLLDGDVDGGK